LIKSYWLRLFLFALGGATIALVASMLAPKKYEAQIQIQIDQKPMTPNIVTSNAEQSVSDLIDFSRPRSLTTQVQTLTSGGVVQEAALKVAEANNWDRTVIKDPESQLFVPTIIDSLAVEADAASDLITLRLRLKDAKLAEDLLREIYLSFVLQNQEGTKELAGLARDAMKKQFGEIQEKLRKVDERTKALREKVGSPDIVTQLQAEIQNLAAMKSARDTATLDLATLTERLKALESQLKVLKPNQSGGSNTAINPIWQRLKSDQAALDAEYKGLLERYLPDRDEVKAIKAKLDLISAELAKESKYSNATDATVPNAARQAVIAQIEEGKANVVGLQDRLRAADVAVAQKEAYLKTLPAAQAELADLNRQQLSLERLYQAYDDRLQTLEAAGSGRMSPTRQVTSAQAFPDPVSPKPVINTLFGIVAGLILGVLSMLAAEAKRQPIRSLAQLNQLAFRPVYRMVPELRAPFRGLSKAPPES